jgi:TPP-dependent pyruvate/acetoin dehydrogenase alpha subunit
MIADGTLTDADYTKMDDEAKAAAQDAWDFADASPEPTPEELFTHIMSDNVDASALAEAGR